MRFCFFVEILGGDLFLYFYIAWSFQLKRRTLSRLMAALADLLGYLQQIKVSSLNPNEQKVTELPKRFGVIGAGPRGVTLAQVFGHLGAKVTVFSRSEQILPKEEPEAVAIVKESMVKDGVAFAFNSTYFHNLMALRR